MAGCTGAVGNLTKALAGYTPPMKFHELTAPQIRGIDREKTVVLIPIAAVEQHGPHLPTGTDTIICTALTEAVETRLPDSVLLTPTFWLGASAHHLRFGATLSSALPDFIASLREIAGSLLMDGFRRLLLVNGHGGNVDPLRVALRELQPSYHDAVLAGGSYWATAGDLIADALDGDHKTVGHACEFETSMILHLQPELVDKSKLADAGKLVADTVNGLFVSRDMKQRTREGCTGRPDLATAKKGKDLFEGITARLVESAEKLLSEPLGREYAEF